MTESSDRKAGHKPEHRAPQTRDQLVAEIRRQELLLVEMRRRSRNTFALMRSIMRRSASGSDNVEEFVNHLEGRIDALCRVQFALPQDSGAGFDLADLISAELLACAAHEGEQFTLNGPAVRLQPKTAESIGLAIHELAINAVKYGALSVTKGRIGIHWLTSARGNHTWLSLDWVESGMTGHPVKESRRGFGTAMLENMLTYDLGAEVRRMFDPAGFRCEIAFPVLANAGR
jgi:two-component sensor histidine kinase